jgi:3-hexulose-6-phosphate synthase/6-phospho-3-hexuloisomerase
MKPVVQVSLDLIDIKDAMEMAHTAMRAGVDWLEAGTPFILAEGLHGVRALRSEFPNIPVVADLKTMDGGYLEAEMMVWNKCMKVQISYGKKLRSIGLITSHDNII